MIEHTAGRNAVQAPVLFRALLDRTGECWQEPEARYRHDSLNNVRSALGEEQFERAYTQGKALSLDQALDLALGMARSA
jgi:hypothetical protein